MLHLDHAGCSIPSLAVQEAVRAHLEREAAVGGYRAAAEATEATERFYSASAALLGATPDTIAFLPSATLAWQAGLDALQPRSGQRILVHRTTYGSNGIAFAGLQQRGVRVECVPSAPDGTIDLPSLASALEAPTALVALTHVPTGSGLVQPAEAVGALCRAAGVPFLLDACQSAGQVALDVEALGCDVLSATGRKYLRGPRGTGILYVRRELLDRGAAPRHLDLTGADWTPEGVVMRETARRFETFERSVAGQIGLGVALAEGNALGWDVLEARIAALAEGLRARLGALAGVRVLDDGTRKCGIVTFDVEGLAPTALRDALRAEDIHVSVTTALSARWHMEARGVSAAVRASVHALNTEDELDRFTRRLDAIRSAPGTSG